jgi:tRNA U34 5-methylaminomethyl-2-thiouridine-forming methyltransferase MnmC
MEARPARLLHRHGELLGNFEHFESLKGHSFTRRGELKYTRPCVRAQLRSLRKSYFGRQKCQGTTSVVPQIAAKWIQALQVAEKLIRSCEKCQGTASAVP